MNHSMRNLTKFIEYACYGKVDAEGKNVWKCVCCMRSVWIFDF